MAILNPSFEDAGLLPGEAEHWTLEAVCSAERIAGFGPVPVRAWEDFERWFELYRALEDVTAVRAFFNDQVDGFEDLEQGWSNEVYLRDLPEGQLAVCPFGGGHVEDMEVDWYNDTYAWSWDEVEAVAGVFGGQPGEPFEVGWCSNELYARSWDEVDHIAAAFDEGIQEVEDYEQGWPPASTI